MLYHHWYFLHTVVDIKQSAMIDTQDGRAAAVQQTKHPEPAREVRHSSASPCRYYGS